MDARDRIVAELARRELARRNYYDYLRLVNGKSWRDTKMAKFLADEIQKFIDADTGNAYDILVIATPPQHGKSMTITEALPSWINGKHPTWRVIQASYNEETAERFCRRNKEKVDAWGEKLFGIGIGKISRATEYELSNNKGRMISRGILSGITGNPANLLIIDDPIKNRMEADSPTTRSRLWDEWQNSLKSRLAASAKVIVIATPWHEDDLMNRIVATEQNVTRISLPVEAQENDPLGRAPGDPLAPELGKDKRWLEQFKAAYINDPEGGQRAWSALYMCSPRTEGGNIINRSWWRTYKPQEVTAFASEVISVDAAFKKGDQNDFVAIEVWGKLGSDYYLRYCSNKHMDFPETVQEIRTVRQLYPTARTVLVEDKANGSAIIQTLQQEMFCIPVNPKGGKVARLNAIASAIESGHVYLPEDAPWRSEFIEQFAAFPAGAHDDMVDSASQALSYLIFRTGGAASLSPEEREREERREAEEQMFLDNDAMYDVYGAAY